MKTAEQILKAKGYDNFEISDIIQANGDESLDMRVRLEFGLENEPLHLWEAYYKGDANEETLEVKAKELNYEGIDAMLIAMDRRLNVLCDEVAEKIQK